jgi:hypothetical protein
MKPKIVLYHLKGNENCYNIYQSLEGVNKLLSDETLWPIFIDLSFNPLIPDKVCSELRKKPKLAYISASLIHALRHNDCTYTADKYIDILFKKGHPLLTFLGDNICNIEDLSGLNFLSLTIEEEKPSINIIDAILALSLSKFEFSVRTRNVLFHAKIKKIGELIEFSQRELMSMQNFGRKSFRELNKFVKEFGLSFKEDIYFDEVKLEEAYYKIFDQTEDENQVGLLEKDLDHTDTEKPKSYLADYISKDSKEHTNIFENFLASLSKLDERQCDILKKRIGFNEGSKTLQELGELYNITRERIRQIEAKAIKSIGFSFSGWNPDNLWGDALESAFSKTKSPLSAHHLNALDSRFEYNDYDENVLFNLLVTVFSKSMNLNIVNFQDQKYLARARQQDLDNTKSAIPSLISELEGKKIKELETHIRGIIPEELNEFTSLLLLDALKYSVIQEIDGEDYLQIYSIRKTSSVIAKLLFIDVDKPLTNQDIDIIIKEKYPGQDTRGVTNTFSDMLDVFPFSHGTWGTIEMLELSPVNNSQIITLTKDFLGSLNKDQFHSQEVFQFIEKHNKGLARLLDDYKVAGFIRYYTLAYPLGRNMFSQTSSENSRIHIKDLIIKIFNYHKKPMKRNILTEKVREIRPTRTELLLAYPEITALGNGYFCLSSWETTVVNNGIYFQIDDTHKKEFLDFSDDNHNQYIILSDSENEKIIKLHGQGFLTKEISEEMSLGYDKVYNTLRKFGLNSNTGLKIGSENQIEEILKLHGGGLSTRSIASEVGLKHTSVFNIIKKYSKSSENKRGKLHKNWSPSRVEKLSQMWKEGISANAIARELGGTTRMAVIGKAKRLKLNNKVDHTSSNEDIQIIKPLVDTNKTEARLTFTDWTEIDVKKLKKLNEFNYSTKSLANILDKQEDDIVNKLNDLKL